MYFAVCSFSMEAIFVLKNSSWKEEQDKEDSRATCVTYLICVNIRRNNFGEEVRAHCPSLEVNV